MKRRSVEKAFDLLGDLCDRLEASIGQQVGDEPRHIIGRVDSAVVGLKRGVMAHQAKQTAAVEIILDELERVARRAVRLAAEHGESIDMEVAHVQD